MMAGNKIKVEKIETFAMDNLSYEQVDVIYRALLAFEPAFPGGAEIRDELLEALRGVVNGRE